MCRLNTVRTIIKTPIFSQIYSQFSNAFLSNIKSSKIEFLIKITEMKTYGQQYVQFSV